jgi:hypothetical protein
MQARPAEHYLKRDEELSPTCAAYYPEIKAYEKNCSNAQRSGAWLQVRSEEPGQKNVLKVAGYDVPVSLQQAAIMHKHSDAKVRLSHLNAYTVNIQNCKYSQSLHLTCTKRMGSLKV